MQKKLEYQVQVLTHSGDLIKSEWDHDENLTTEDAVRDAYSMLIEPEELAEISGITVIVEESKYFAPGTQVLLKNDAIAGVALVFRQLK